MDPLVTAAGLTFAYPNGKVLFEDVSIVAYAGTLTCVVGRSGIGKSTLLYCLAGVLRSAGEIKLAGQALSTSASQRASLRLKNCGFIFQRGELLPELTILENVALPFQLTGNSRKSAHEAAAKSLDELSIYDCRDRKPNEISGGQAQRASVARALIHQLQ